MEDNVLVSIITVCYNSERTIGKTLESVLHQTYKNIEYIIIDGASTDYTLNIIKKYEPLFDNRLMVISESDSGIYDAMNKGIDNAKGEIIGIINSDDYYEEDAIESAVIALRNNHDNSLSVYYGGVAYTDNENISEVRYSDANRLEETMISHPGCFVTKECYRVLGKYDTRYKCVADYDLMLKYFRSKKVSFIPINSHIATFTIGGISGTNLAAYELYDLRYKYGQISFWRKMILTVRDKISYVLKKHGYKFTFKRGFVKEE